MNNICSFVKILIKMTIFRKEALKMFEDKYPPFQGDEKI